MNSSTDLLTAWILHKHGRHLLLEHLLDLESKSTKIALIIRGLVVGWWWHYSCSRNLKELVVGVREPRAVVGEKDKDPPGLGLEGLFAGLEHGAVLGVVEEQIRQDDGVVHDFICWEGSIFGERVEVGEQGARVAAPEVSLHDHGAVLDLGGDIEFGVVLDIAD